ncbi:acyl-CoA dehydrogenase [Acetobacter senegalensis DSM 18889]|nr:acyl-CoA dehydrogenase [Acetobacter senegalensis DSM 18889]
MLKRNRSVEQERSSVLWEEAFPLQYPTEISGYAVLLEDIRQQSAKAEVERALPFEAIKRLKQSGFTALRVPAQYGGLGRPLSELFSAVIDLATADSNVAQALRAHFGFVEHLLFEQPSAYTDQWFKRVGKGETAGAAAAEKGTGRDRFATTVSRKNEHFVINGSKFFTTGSLYADWLTVTASTQDGQTVKCLASRHDPGLNIVDDWDGIGQRLTASGTAYFQDVRVHDDILRYGNTEFPYSQAFFQLYHLATVAGITQAAALDIAGAVKNRKRAFSHANHELPAQDPQILEIVGQVASAAHAARSIVRHAAEALQAAVDKKDEDRGPDIIKAELEVWQAQEIIFPLTLNATSLLFDALGGTATLRSAALDRYWRNIRTIGCHNPRVYRTRIVGDYLVNGNPPPGQWRVGTV